MTIPMSGDSFANRDNDNIEINENCYYVAMQYILIAEPGKIRYFNLTSTNKAVNALMDKINASLDMRYSRDTARILRVSENFKIAMHYFKRERIRGEEEDIKRIINLADSWAGGEAHTIYDE